MKTAIVGNTAPDSAFPSQLGWGCAIRTERGAPAAGCHGRVQYRWGVSRGWREGYGRCVGGRVRKGRLRQGRIKAEAGAAREMKRGGARRGRKEGRKEGGVVRCTARRWETRPSQTREEEEEEG